jgi:hypothetical protein
MFAARHKNYWVLNGLGVAVKVVALSFPICKS